MLSEYDIELKHIEGKEPLIADCLSRAENHIFLVSSLTHNTKTEKNLREDLFNQIAKTNSFNERVKLFSDFLSRPGRKTLQNIENGLVRPITQYNH